MYSKIVRITCLAALGLMAAFRFEGGIRLLAQFVVCGAAALVLTEAIRSRKHLWAIAFALIAVYFNPILPVDFCAWQNSRSCSFAWCCLRRLYAI